MFRINGTVHKQSKNANLKRTPVLSKKFIEKEIVNEANWDTSHTISSGILHEAQ